MIVYFSILNMNNLSIVALLFFCALNFITALDNTTKELPIRTQANNSNGPDLAKDNDESTPSSDSEPESEPSIKSDADIVDSTSELSEANNEPEVEPKSEQDPNSSELSEQTSSDAEPKVELDQTSKRNIESTIDNTHTVEPEGKPENELGNEPEGNPDNDHSSVSQNKNEPIDNQNYRVLSENAAKVVNAKSASRKYFGNTFLFYHSLIIAVIFKFCVI